MKNSLLRFTACTALAAISFGFSAPAQAQRGGSHGGGGHGGGHGGGGGRGGGGFRGGYGGHGGGYGWRGGGLGWWGPGLGLGLGWGAAYPYYDGYPYAASPYPDDYEADTMPPVTGSDAAPNPNWYYCDSARDYYPRVTQCPEAWRLIPATPTAQPQ